MMERINNEINRRVPHVRTLREISWELEEERKEDIVENLLVGLVTLGLIAIAAAFAVFGCITP